MRQLPARSVFLAASALSLLLGACGTEASEPSDAGVVTVFGPWRGPSAAQFRAALGQFEEETGIDARYIGTADFANDILERTRAGDPPDVAIFPQPGLMGELADLGHVMPLPPELAELARAAYRPELLEVGSRFGEIVGVPYRLNVKSLVWYSPATFRQLGYAVPRDWFELQVLEDQMIFDGHTPWCLGVEAFGASGWPATDWVEDILLRLHGIDAYDRWVAGDLTFLDHEISDAFSVFALETMAPGRSLGGRAGILNTSTSRAQDPMFESPPRCLMHRQASFYRNNLPEGITAGPDGDTDVFVLPPMDPGLPNPLLIGGDLAAAMRYRDESWALIRFLASPESGVAWARMGQYISPHLDFDISEYGSEFDARMDRLMNEAEVIRFDGSDLMPPAVGTGTFLEAMLSFISNDRLRDALELAQSGYEG